jgi:hypothetical protein
LPADRRRTKRPSADGQSNSNERGLSAAQPLQISANSLTRQICQAFVQKTKVTNIENEGLPSHRAPNKLAVLSVNLVEELTFSTLPQAGPLRGPTTSAEPPNPKNQTTNHKTRMDPARFTPQPGSPTGPTLAWWGGQQEANYPAVRSSISLTPCFSPKVPPRPILKTRSFDSSAELRFSLPSAERSRPDPPP